MGAANNSRRTIDERLRIVRAFAGYLLLPLDGPGAYAPTWQQIAGFLTDGDRSPGTRKAYLAALRAFSKWLILTDRATVDPTLKLPKVRAPRALPRPVSTDQLSLALASGRFYSRTRTMVLLAAYQGLRVHEIAKVRGEDIRGDTLRVVGKGGKDVLLPLHPVIAAEAGLYPRIGWWFSSPNDRTRPVLANSVSTLVSQGLHRAGVPATAHQLRHWFGTESLRSSGGNVRVCQELLRHASLATTAVYTQVDDAERRAALVALPAPGSHSLRLVAG